MYADRLRHCATATGCYSGPALKLLGNVLDKLDADLERQKALRRCRKNYNPDGDRSNWQTAIAIHEGIQRVGRIRPGRLLTETEEALTTLAGGAQSARRIFDTLVEIDDPPSK